jgi:hypothetical protein
LTYPGILFWLVVLRTAFARGPGFYYVFFGCWSLGTLLVIPSGISLGNLTPPWIAACILTARVIVEDGPRRYLSALLDFRRFGVLTLCTLYAAASGYFLPRIFEGRVNVITMRTSAVHGEVPLQPDAANLTQGLYFVITTLTVVSIYLICQEPARRRRFLQAFGWGGAVAILTGLVDLVASAAGLGGLLEPFRNATYALHLDNEAAGMHRVIGLMSEASAYAALCAPFLCLAALTPGRDSPWGRWRIPLCLGLVVMTYLSTSSGGYVGLLVLGLVLAASLANGMVEKRRGAWLGGYGMLAAAAAVAMVFLLDPSIFEPLWRAFDRIVLAKTNSVSYIERSMWNRVAYQAYLGTNYLGVGIGGARASSWIYSLLSNIGAPGTLLLFIFIAQVVAARVADPADRTLARAAKLALVPCLFMASLAGTSAGFGLPGAILFGLAASLCWPTPRPVRQATKRGSYALEKRALG